jgi:hypothetical protein
MEEPNIPTPFDMLSLSPPHSPIHHTTQDTIFLPPLISFMGTKRVEMHNNEENAAKRLRLEDTVASYPTILDAPLTTFSFAPPVLDSFVLNAESIEPMHVDTHTSYLAPSTLDPMEPFVTLPPPVTIPILEPSVVDAPPALDPSVPYSTSWDGACDAPSFVPEAMDSFVPEAVDLDSFVPEAVALDSFVPGAVGSFFPEAVDLDPSAPQPNVVHTAYIAPPNTSTDVFVPSILAEEEVVDNTHHIHNYLATLINDSQGAPTLSPPTTT